MSQKLLRLKQVCVRLEVSPMTLWRMRDRGEFPQGIYLRPGNRQSIRWPESVVNAWIEERMGA